MQENYKILAVDENCSDEELDLAYTTLKEKYSKERFYEGEIGNEAAKKLTRIENAYAEIKAERSEKRSSEFDGDFAKVENLIKDKKYDEAQSLLDGFTDRNAEWHYLQSVIFYKKSWINESKKQLEIAVSMDGDNAKYKESLSRLNQKINFDANQFHSGNANMQGERQMGGSATSDCCSFCVTWCIMDMLCSMCCR